MLRINWYEKVLGNQMRLDGRRLWGRVVQNNVSNKLRVRKMVPEHNVSEYNIIFPTMAYWNLEQKYI